MSLPRPMTMRWSAVDRHLGEKMAGDEHRAPLVGERAHQGADPEDALRVETVHRLVEEQHLGVAEHRRGDAEALGHAEGERPRALAGDAGEPDALEHRRRRGRGRCRCSGRGRAGGCGRSVRGAPPWRRGARRRCAAAAGVARSGRPPIVTEPEVGVVESEHHAQGRRLARTVGAEEPGHPPGSTSKDSPSTASVAPYRFVSPRASITDAVLRSWVSGLTERRIRTLSEPPGAM